MPSFLDCFLFGSRRTGLTKFCLTLPKISTKFVKRGRSKIFVNHMCQSRDKSLHRNLRRISGSTKQSRRHRWDTKIKAPKECAVDYFSRYKLNSTWPWRCSWNRTSCILNKGRYAAYQGTNLPSSPLIAAQLRNNFGGLQIEILRLKIEIKFS